MAEMMAASWVCHWVAQKALMMVDVTVAHLVSLMAEMKVFLMVDSTVDSMVEYLDHYWVV